MKKIIFILFLVIVYVLLCWITNFWQETIILNSSGKPFILDFNLLYTTFTFYIEDDFTRKVEYVRKVVQLDFLFVVSLLVGILVRFVFYFFMKGFNKNENKANH